MAALLMGFFAAFGTTKALVLANESVGA